MTVDTEANDTQARQILATARAIYRGRAPYLYPTLCKLVVVWTRQIPTAAVTERAQLLLNPDFLVTFSDKEGDEAIAGLLAHEVLHIALLHMDRVGGRSPERWNVAADLFINGALSEVGWSLPSCGVFPEQYGLPRGLTADEYYDLLPEGAKGGDGPCAGSCGSGAGGEPVEGEPSDADVDSDGQPVEGRTPDEIRGAAEAAARAVAEAAAKGQGSVPAALARWADQALQPPKVRWQDRLRGVSDQTIRKAGRGRRTYALPHRRQACLGAHPRSPVLPSRFAVTVSVWFAVDTSGSMSQPDLVRCASELDGLLRTMDAKVSVLACDADVQGEPLPVKSVRDALPTLVGGGGTDFRPIFERALAEPPATRPKVIVVATDGGGPAPQRQPDGTAVIWLLVGRHAVSPCSWGEQIWVDD